MRLPYEILRDIGLYLDQINQKECCLVCKQWKASFQTLVFQKVVLLEQRHADSYVQQDASLRKLTTSLHFNITLTDKLFEEYAQASPNVHTLTLFVNLLNNLSIPKTVSVIKKYWLKNLIKIRMDELILPEVLPLLSHQLEDVTGGFGAFYNERTGKLIPMPKLKILDIEMEEEKEIGNTMTAQVLDDMRIAYPKLQDLTISYFFLEPIDNEQSFVYTPFPHVRSFHMKNCRDELDSYNQIKKMFTNLKSFSFLRTNVSNAVKWSPNPYEELVTQNPNLKELNLLYLSGMAQGQEYPILKKLNNLNSFHLERSIGTDIITKRELLDLDFLISSAPRLKKLKVYGLFHATHAAEPFENYLTGTVGFCEDENSYLPIGTHRRTAEDVRFTLCYEDENGGEDDFTPFGNGEQLYKGKTQIITVKKRMPLVDGFSDFQKGEWEWHEKRPFPHRLTPISSPITTTFAITNLHLEWVTLRNPTYAWIANHLPLLEEFQVLKSEPYPFFEIVLGKSVKTFNITLDTRYDHFGTPIVTLCSNNVEKCIKYIEEGWQDYDLDCRGRAANMYAVRIECGPALKNISICEHSLSNVLQTIKIDIDK